MDHPARKRAEITPSSSTDSLPLLPIHDVQSVPLDAPHTNSKGRISSYLSDPAREFFNRNKGLFLIALSNFFASGMFCIVKLMSSADNGTASESPRVRVPTLELIVIRMGLSWFFATGWMFYKKVPHPILGPPNIRKWLVIRGVVGFFGLFGIYFSVQYLSLSDATVITFLSPFVTAFLGWLLLNESISLKESCAGVTSFTGVILIARPTFLFKTSHSGSITSPVLHGTPVANSTSHGNLMRDGVLEDSVSSALVKGHSDGMRMIAVGVALIGVLGASGAYTSLRRIGKNAHPMHSVAYFCAWSVLVSIAATYVLEVRWVMPPDWLWGIGLIATAVLGFSAQTLLALGFQHESAGRGSLAMYVQIIFALALERMVFKVTPPLLSVIGMIIILSSAIFVALSKPSESTARKTAQMRMNPNSNVSQQDISLGVPSEAMRLVTIHHEDDGAEELLSDDGWSDGEKTNVKVSRV